jgi:hypothetical protein
VKHHAKHLLMCAPMLLVGLVLIAGGAGVGVLIGMVACVLMMGMMMGGMGDERKEQGSGPKR